MPLGLFIFAAREQYSNWEAGIPPDPIAGKFFEHLRTVRKSDIWQDLIYELDWPVKRPAPHYILQKELQWNTYDEYFTDISQTVY